jgi:chemotaxis protein MotB
MSDGENHHHGKNEIIIVKRHHGGEHEGAHGGAWKIAYADFMTAMMAFFLVMWLVNAANEETKASVASYFNPIKLSDEKPTEKGLKKPVDKAEGEQKQEQSDKKEDKETVGASSATGEDQTASAGDNKNYSEADFFENPYSVLAEIAQEVGQQANVSAKGEGGASDSGPATGADGGEAYRDPFDPDFWTKQVQVTTAEPAAKAVEVAALDPKDTPVDPAAKLIKVADSALPETPQKPSTDPVPTPEQVAMAVPQPKPSEAQRAESKAASAAEMKAAADLRADIEKQIGDAAGKLAEGLVVTPSEGGMLVSISDQSNAPMFTVGSAVPGREMVLVMEKIGQLLAKRDGSIVIRGHTDGRQFKGGENDNWRLSMARAHSAYYMLVHGGLKEDRIKQVSGFADRRLQVPEDPLNNANRRIEILIQTGQG